jgi:crotonobetainyl-CoA:carnitine CoA-transferase CaiB-like acyl-CoA transferase
VCHHLGADTSPYTTDQLIDILAQNDIPVGRANMRSEVSDDPQVVASGLLEISEHPRGGVMRQPRSAARFSQAPYQLRHHSPEIGQHTVEILTELGLSLEDMQALAREGIIA